MEEEGTKDPGTAAAGTSDITAPPPELPKPSSVTPVYEEAVVAPAVNGLTSNEPPSGTARLMLVLDAPAPVSNGVTAVADGRFYANRNPGKLKSAVGRSGREHAASAKRH